MLESSGNANLEDHGGTADGLLVNTRRDSIRDHALAHNPDTGRDEVGV